MCVVGVWNSTEGEGRYFSGIITCMTYSQALPICSDAVPDWYSKLVIGGVFIWSILIFSSVFHISVPTTHLHTNTRMRAAGCVSVIYKMYCFWSLR